MQAIETVYKGHRMRSRLEGRWSHFWDAMGIPWRYEGEAFDLGTVRYLPDFWLPTFRAWVEIKGEVRDDEAGLRIVEQCTQLAIQSSRPVILCFHDPFDPRCALFQRDRMYAQTRWTACPQCGALSIGVRSEENTITWCVGNHTDGQISPSALRFHRGLLYNAALAARQARFGFPRIAK